MSVMWVKPLLDALKEGRNFEQEWRELGDNVIRPHRGQGRKVLDLFSVAALRLGKVKEPIDDEFLTPLRQVCGGGLPRVYSWTHHFGRYAELAFLWCRTSNDFSWVPAMMGAFACGPQFPDAHIKEEMLWVLSCWHEIGFDVSPEYSHIPRLTDAGQRVLTAVEERPGLTVEKIEAYLEDRDAMDCSNARSVLSELKRWGAVDSDQPGYVITAYGQVIADAGKSSPK